MMLPREIVSWIRIGHSELGARVCKTGASATIARDAADARALAVSRRQAIDMCIIMTENMRVASAAFYSKRFYGI